jgi:hypothetical protein
MWQRRCIRGEIGLHRVLTIYLFMLFRGIEDPDEHAWALVFYIQFAKDHIQFRRFVQGRSMMSLLSHPQVFTTTCRKCEPVALDSIYSSCYALTVASRMSWMVPALLETDLCNLLFRILE